jgi:IS30 family transposase
MNIQTDSSEKMDYQKEMDFNQVNQGFISSVASKRNHIPRKSLNYQTPLEVFF